MHKKAFTLIELLIVITIIGILAVALLPSILGAPARARDAARKADLNSVIAAIETYNADYAGYPQCDREAYTFRCIGPNNCINMLEGYFQGGAAPWDPQTSLGNNQGVPVGRNTTCRGYGYIHGTGNPYNYAVVSKVEQWKSGNISCREIQAIDSPEKFAALKSRTLKEKDVDDACFIIFK
jgi:prepilin-type N-terminal cleavage/methylation domain-containing protein